MFAHSFFAAAIMYPCAGSSGSLEVLCRLLKLLDIAKSSVQDTDASTDARFMQIKTKMEELQLKMVREILCREDRAMVQLRQVEHCIDDMMMGAKDAQSFSSILVVDNLNRIETSIDKAIVAAGESAAVYDGLYKRIKSSKDFAKKDGPWGPRLGIEWDMGPLHNIKTIYVSANDRIHSIRFEYKYDDHKEYRTPLIGGEGGTLHQIELDAEEPIKFIRGGYDTAGLTKLEIITSKQTHSFGKGNGESTVFPPTSKLDCNYKIVGFFGRASSYVHALGVYLEKCPNCPPDSSPFPTMPTSPFPTMPTLIN